MNKPNAEEFIKPEKKPHSFQRKWNTTRGSTDALGKTKINALSFCYSTMLRYSNEKYFPLLMGEADGCKK